MTSETFVICCDCGSTVYACDPHSVVKMDEAHIWLKCLNNCCGHVSRYSTIDLINAAQGGTIDHTSRLFVEA